jgi:HEAT repeat protein
MDENFHLEIDRKYHTIEQDIINVLLSIPKDTSVTEVLITLLKDKSLDSLYADIIHTLSKIGHPAAFPALLEFLEEKHEAARSALVSMALGDISELKELLARGIIVDMWGNDLKEKLFISMKTIIPLLFDVLASGDYSLQDKYKICFLFKEIGVQSKSDYDFFMKLLPELYREDIQTCYVTDILIAGGLFTVSLIRTALEEEIANKGTYTLPLLKRFFYILGEIGVESKSTILVLEKAINQNNDLADSYHEALKKISPYHEQLEVEKRRLENIKKEQTNNDQKNDHMQKTSGSDKTDDETGTLIDKIQKDTINTNPEDYVLY